MPRLKVCQLVTDLDPYGAGKAVCELSRRLDRDRFDGKVVALRGGALAGLLEQAGIEVRVLDVRGTWPLPKLSRLTDALRAQSLDLLHTHLFGADLAGRPAARLAAVPHVVHTVHLAGDRFRPWKFAYARFLATTCDRIVCPCESVRDLHARRSGLPPWRYVVIPDGVDAEMFRDDEASRRRLRGQWNLADDQILVAYVGRLDHDKGIDVLLGAISHLGARGDPINVVIAGDGPKRPVVENFIVHGEGGSHARLLRGVDDLPALLRAADVFVMPSRREVWPLPVLEAMAAGLPVIGTDVGGIRETVADGQTGIVIGPSDVAALAETVSRLAEDGRLREALGQAARRRAVEQFPIDTYVEAHEKLYMAVASEESGQS